jgi:hypothetical protein
MDYRLDGIQLFGGKTIMKTIQNQEQNMELKKAVERIVKDIKMFSLCRGNVSIERELPPDGTPAATPAGYPHLTVYMEEQRSIIGLIPYKKKTIICVIKEGFYDIQETGKKDMLVLLRYKDAQTVIKSHLEEYGKKNQVTEIVYKA